MPTTFTLARFAYSLHQIVWLWGGGGRAIVNFLRLCCATAEAINLFAILLPYKTYCTQWYTITQFLHTKKQESFPSRRVDV